jgi:hypothetical protein
MGIYKAKTTKGANKSSEAVDNAVLPENTNLVVTGGGL